MLQNSAFCLPKGYHKQKMRCRALENLLEETIMKRNEVLMSIFRSLVKENVKVLAKKDFFREAHFVPKGERWWTKKKGIAILYKFSPLGRDRIEETYYYLPYTDEFLRVKHTPYPRRNRYQEGQLCSEKEILKEVRDGFASEIEHIERFLGLNNSSMAGSLFS